MIFYALPSNLNWLSLPYILSILATLALSLGFVLLRRRWPGLLAAWLSYLVILAPNSGIIRNNSFTIAADRYSYVSMLGLVSLAAAGFCWLWRMSSQRRPGAIGIIAIGLGAILGLTAMTRDQCRTWRDAEALWAHALSHGANDSYLAHNKLGVALRNKGSFEAAAAHYTAALRLNPGYVDAHYNLGNVLATQGKYEAAAACYAEAIRLNPAYDKAQYNWGVLLSTQGKREAAAAHFAEALRLNPGLAAAHLTRQAAPQLAPTAVRP